MLMASVLISKSDSRMRNAGTKKAPIMGLCGVPGATRTPGLPLRRRSLYPTELREHGLWGVAQGECTSSTLGGGRSILLSYGNSCGVFNISSGFGAWPLSNQEAIALSCCAIGA